MIVMPKTHWQNILNTLRSKTGKSNLLLSGEVASEIDSISGGYGDIPSHHFTEAGRVIEKIRTFKLTHPNCLVFGAVSDIHVYNGNATYEAKSKTSIKHAAFALEMVGAMAECDFIANLGDNCWENGIDTDNALLGAEYSISELKSAFNRLPRYNLVGNHDKSDNTQAQFDLIGSCNEYDAHGKTQIRGFGYKDYTAKKVRVIVLNTCDYLNASGGCALSYDQKDFLMRALDLSAKSDASEWQILLLSHIPLDWNGGDYNFYGDLQTILKGYENGSSISVMLNPSYFLNEDPSKYATYLGSSGLVYNYASKNQAKIIANIHGHVHTNKVSKIANTSIARVATPNTNPDLNKSESYPDYGDYSITSTEAAKITKVSGTAKDTSATFYCIDLDKQVIYAYGYGADIDRTIPYKDAVVYSVSYNMTLCKASNTAATAVGGTSFTTTVTPTDAAGVIKSVKVTMGGADITNSCYSSGTISIANVTGNIIITAVAELQLVSETITPHIASRSTWFGGLGTDGALTLHPSNMEGALGVSTANSHEFTDRSNNTFYLMPIDGKYCKATLNYSATDGLAVVYYLQAVKDNNGKLTSVATVGKGTNNVITWTKGVADYLLISIEHTDGSSKWDWDSAGKTISVTFSNQ